MVEALEGAGCRMLFVSPAGQAPFRLVFETREGERMGVIAYSFLANSRETRNRPSDEHRFQVKYGSKDGALHEIWQDPYGLYTTLFLGIDPDLGIFVGADPVLHNPTRLFISIEFKRHDVAAILAKGWHAWERERRQSTEEPVEVLVGGTSASFLDFIRFERAALGEDQGHRQLLAEKRLFLEAGERSPAPMSLAPPLPANVHALAREFALSESEVLELIGSARRLKMAVRGWVAEEHLSRMLKKLPEVIECERLDEEGGPDVRLRLRGGEQLTVECKNVLRQKTADGLARVDLQRTRASKSDPCSRFYRAEDFDLVAACMHAVTERWEFQFVPSRALDAHARCAGRLSNLVRVDSRWSDFTTAAHRFGGAT